MRLRRFGTAASTSGSTSLAMVKGGAICGRGAAGKNGGTCGALAPPLVAHSAPIVAENLVLPLAVVTTLACWCTLTDRPGGQRVWFGPAMVLLHVTHNRFALRWTRPGDRFVTSLRLTARDAADQPLPPGRYEVGIDLEQVGFGSFVEPGQERGDLIMVVR